MNLIFENNYKHIYFLGIGGISMSGLAEILHSKGFLVSGSDMKESKATNHLLKRGIKIYIGHNYENITDDIDLLVYTAAVKEDNPEMIAAKDKGIKIIDRAELLGEVMKSYESAIAVSGTHGKTTTTSMISEILLSADADPTISIGGILPSINGNIKIGNSKYFIAEACEYFDSFLKFNPLVAVILNVEADHLDYFKDLNQIQTSFKKFAQRVRKEGTVVINKEIENLDYIIDSLKCNVVTYSSTDKKADWTAENIIHVDDGKNSFDAVFKGEVMGRVSLNIPGNHNIANALAACAAASSVGMDMKSIIKGLGNFGGAKRRFQFKGSFNGTVVIDDYAHHPTEVRTTLEAAKNVKHNKLWCVFQPHTFSRTKAFLNEFANSFENADNIIIAKIYAAREKDTGEISGQDLAEKIKNKGKNAIYIDNFEQIEEYLIRNCKQGDMLITMGAGDVYLVGEAVIK